MYLYMNKHYDILVDNKSIYKFEYNVLHYFNIVMIAMVGFYLFGITQTESSYILQVNFVLKILIALFLVYRFNRYRYKINFTELDRRVAHSAGWYILFISFADYLETIKSHLHTFFGKSIQPLLSGTRNSGRYSDNIAEDGV